MGSYSCVFLCVVVVVVCVCIRERDREQEGRSGILASHFDRRCPYKIHRNFRVLSDTYIILVCDSCRTRDLKILIFFSF